MAVPGPASRDALRGDFGAIVGESPALLAVLALADQAAPTPWPLLITGETGTGKSALAEAIHRSSGRPGRFVALNCAALTPSLLESELFGHRKGAFTGATADSPGLFEAADGGTLLLDEIGDMDLEAQARLLRVIESGVVRRVGDDGEIPIDVRVIGATHRPLTECIGSGQFREDLFYRINSFVLEIPPLRERRGDLPALAAELLARDATGTSKQLDSPVLEALRAHDWPGNLRELQSVLRQAAAQAGSETAIRIGDLPPLGSRILAGASDAQAGATSRADLVRLLHQVMATGATDVLAWARFLLGFAQVESSVNVSRAAIVPVLRTLRGPDPTENALNLQWARELRPLLVETGLVVNTGKRLTIEVRLCREALGLTTAGDSADPSASSAGDLDLPGGVPADTGTAGLPPPTNLPTRPIRLFGRAADVRAISDLLVDRPAVTILGPGGMGKTQLARLIGQARLRDFPGGTWFIDLSGARNADDICTAVATVLGLAPSSLSPAERVATGLAERGRLLLILDNFEQVVDDAPTTVGHWLASVPGARLLVTSRALLSVSGEVRYELQPLSVPAAAHGQTPASLAGSDAVALFVDRARRAQPAFSLSDSNADDIAAIVIGLSGIPLAIEMAAARLRLLSPGAIAARLTQRLELLRGSRRDVLSHQRTMRDALDWSYRLLAPWEQAAFTRLCVFRGGFALDAIETVLGALPDGQPVLDAIESLLDKSFVRSGEAADDGVRYDMYVVIRDYGLEQLRATLAPGELEWLADRHMAWFADRCREWLERPVRERIEIAEVDGDNLAVALDRALERGDGEAIGPLATMLTEITQVRGSVEELARQLDPVMAPGPEALGDAYWYRLLSRRSSTEFSLNSDFTTLHAPLEQSAARARRQADAATGDERLAWLKRLADCVRWQAIAWHHNYPEDVDGTCEALGEVSAIAEQAGDWTLVAWAESLCGTVALLGGRYDEAESRWLETIPKAEKAGGTQALHLRYMLADLDTWRGRPELAVEKLEKLLGVGDQTARTYHTLRSAILPRHFLAIAYANSGATDRAMQMSAEAEDLARRNGNHVMVAHTRWASGRAALAAGDAATALRHFQVTNRLARQFDNDGLEEVTGTLSASLMVASGDIDDARRLLDDTVRHLDQPRETPRPIRTFLAAAARAIVHRAFGDTESARRQVAEARAIESRDDFYPGMFTIEIGHMRSVLADLEAAA